MQLTTYTRPQLTTIYDTKAPIFTRQASPRCGSAYRFLSTGEVVTALEARGFEVTATYAARALKNNENGERVPYVRHGVFMRDKHDSNENLKRIIKIQNSHEGTAALTINVGYLRLVCLNGLYATRETSVVSMRHSGNASIDQAIQQIYDKFAALRQLYEMWGRVTLNIEHIERLATIAASLRTVNDRPLEVFARQLQFVRRDADTQHTLFNVYNVLQENLTRGVTNHVGIGSNVRMRKQRALGAVGASELTAKLHGVVNDYVQANNLI